MTVVQVYFYIVVYTQRGCRTLVLHYICFNQLERYIILYDTS